MAAVARDLAQQERWLSDYRLDEKRHARRVMLHELIYRLELGRRRLVRSAKRLTLISLRSARAIASFLARTVAAAILVMRRFVAACDAWVRPRAYRLSRTLWQWLTAFSAWIGLRSRILSRNVASTTSIWLAWFAAKSRALALALGHWLLIFGGWTSVQAGRLARASRRTASASSSWVTAQSRALSIALLHWVVRTSRRARALARILVRNSLHGARIASAWTAAMSREAATSTRAAALQLQHHLYAGAAGLGAKAKQAAHSSVAANGLLRADPPTSQTHNALVVRRSTALVCFEPKQRTFPSLPAG